MRTCPTCGKTTMVFGICFTCISDPSKHPAAREWNDKGLAFLKDNLQVIFKYDPTKPRIIWWAGERGGLAVRVDAEGVTYRLLEDGDGPCSDRFEMKLRVEEYRNWLMERIGTMSITSMNWFTCDCCKSRQHLDNVGYAGDDGYYLCSNCIEAGDEVGAATKEQQEKDGRYE